MAERQDEFRTPRGGGETILRTSGLSKRFGNITAVQDLDLDVRAGEVLGFLGPNGSGKSTTVGMILGLIEPTAGGVELFGKPLAEQREALTRQVGAIIETPAFYPYLSGRDNLRALAMAIGGVPAGRIDELLTLVGLQERAGGKFKTYSLGMKQRLGIASTLLTNPSLVILDEPTNGLDPAGQREIRDLIPDLARQGHAVLLASHLLHEVEQVCERVAIIRSGRLIEFGRVADLVAKGGYLDVKLRPDEIAAAAQVLQPLPFVESVAPREGGLAVIYTGDYGAEINRVLAGQGIFAAALIPRQSSLEDIFLELTEGSSPGEQNVQTGGPAMLPLLRSEIFRLRRRWMAIILLLVVVLGVAAVYVILWLVYANTSSAQEQSDLARDLGVRSVSDVGMDIVNFLASIVAVILAASIIGTEFGWGTIRALLPRARSRASLIAAKLITLTLFDLLIVLAGFVTATVFSSVIANVEDLDSSLNSDFWGDAVQAIAINLFVLLPYSALAFFVAVLTRSNAAGIAIGLAILLAEGIIVAILEALSDSLEWIGDLLFTNNMAAILNENNPGGRGPNSDLPDTGQAIVVLTVWLILLVGGSFWIFRRRDVTSG